MDPLLTLAQALSVDPLVSEGTRQAATDVVLSMRAHEESMRGYLESVDQD